MPQFLIERNIPGAGKLSKEQLKEISAHSCGVISEMNAEGIGVKWINSHVTPDKIFCLYEGPDERSIRDHAARGGFPATNVFPVAGEIGPQTARG
jgi:hypothetical protein